MSLGETIYKLRTAQNMSQGDLADTLNVSRQSISKWETNTSVPDLDKLIKISQIFGITLDELILEKPSPEQLGTNNHIQERSSKQNTRVIAGIILLCFGIFIWLMITILGDFLSGLVFSLPFLFCGLICLFVHKHTGLWCSWTLYCLMDLYLRHATGSNWRFAIWSIMYATGITAHTIVGWCQLLCFIVLTFITILRFQNSKAPGQRKEIIISIILWVIYLLSHFILVIPSTVNPTNPTQIRLILFASSIIDCIRNILLISSIVFSVRVCKLLWKKNRSKSL